MSTGLKRKGYEIFYTKKEIAKKCCEIIKELKIIKNTDKIIEPSAGNGSFIEYIKLLSKNYIFYDINPNHEEIIKQDFLKLNENLDDTHIIGNPPFGRQSSLAKKFIKKVSSAKSISFILPKSFKKESLKKTFSLNFHLIHEHDLPSESFNVNNENYNVPCVFQIWVKKNYNREILEKEEPYNFKFVKKEDNHDISFRRVGIYSGEISIETENKSPSSHYFIKFLDSKILDKIEQLKIIKFPSDNTVGARSISKPELIREFNKIIK